MTARFFCIMCEFFLYMCTLHVFPSLLSVTPVSLGGLKAGQPKPGGPASSQQKHPEQDCFVHYVHYLPVNVMQTWLTLFAMFNPPPPSSLFDSFPLDLLRCAVVKIKEELPNKI